MRPLQYVLRGESPVLFARELVWRTRKQWNKRRLPAQVRKECPVIFRNLPYYHPTLELCDARARACIVGIADMVCRGEFPFLGHGTARLGLPPPWNLDFVSGKEWPNAAAGSLVAVRHDGSDVKVPWELSRLQVLPVLGKAHFLTGSEDYRQIAKALVTDWIRRNPVGVGVNWSVAMEAALRAISICFLLSLLSPFRADEAEWLQAATRSLWEHLLFIEAHSEFSHIIRSNHYLSNVLGLLCLSLFLEGAGADMEPRRTVYSERLQQEIFRQVYADGGHYEASTGYHVLVTQMFTTALLLMRADGTEPHPAFVERLRRMYWFMAELADAQGRLPHVGDCDDGRTELLLDDLQQMLSVPVPKRHSLCVGGLLGIGAGLLRESLGGTTQDAAWYGLASQGSSVTSGCRALPSPPVAVFPESGVAVARNQDCEVLFFAIPNGLRGKGSHTHNDKLSVVLRLKGEELLCDSGTCCYTRDRNTRNQFRGTPCHNTARIDAQEQNTVPDANHGLFCIGNEAQVGPITSRHLPGVLELAAAHEGYRRIGVRHSRVVRLRENGLELEDHFNGSGEHRIELNFHLPEEWQVTPTPGERPGFAIVGPRDAKIVWQSLAPLVLGSEGAAISRAYGATSPSTRIRVATSTRLPVVILTRLSWDQ